MFHNKNKICLIWCSGVSHRLLIGPGNKDACNMYMLSRVVCFQYQDFLKAMHYISEININNWYNLVTKTSVCGSRVFIWIIDPALNSLVYMDILIINFLRASSLWNGDYSCLYHIYFIVYNLKHLKFLLDMIII